jgi:hypothetical protein
MSSVIFFILICSTFLISVGKAFDYLSYNSEKALVYQNLKKFGERIDNTNFPNLLNLVFEKTFLFFDKYFNWKKEPITTIIRIIFLSWLFTTFISFLVKYNPACNCDTPSFSFYEIGKTLPFYDVYLINFIFDLITVYLTLKIFKFIHQKKTYTAITFIIIDLLISFFLSWSCFTVLEQSQWLKLDNKLPFYEKFNRNSNNLELEILDNFEYSLLIKNKSDLSNYLKKSNIKNFNVENIPENVSGKIYKKMDNVSFQDYFEQVKSFIKNDSLKKTRTHNIVLNYDSKTETHVIRCNIAVSSKIAGYSLSSFLPILFYAFLLFIVILSKPILYLSKTISKRIINTSIQDVNENEIFKFKPGGHFGAVLSIIIAIFELIKELLNTI